MSEEAKQSKTIKPNIDSYTTYIANIKRVMYGKDVLLSNETAALATLEDLISLTFYNLKRRTLELCNLRAAGSDPRQTITFSSVKHGARLEFPTYIVEEAFDLLYVMQSRLVQYTSKKDTEAALKESGPYKRLKSKYGKEMYFLNKQMYDSRVAKQLANAKEGNLRTEVKCGTMFPISRIQNHLRLNHGYRCTKDASLAIAAILEITTIHLLTRSVKKLGNNKKTITARHIMLAIQTDKSDTLLPMFQNVVIENSGEPEYYNM